jgi:hypothetical protein
VTLGLAALLMTPLAFAVDVINGPTLTMNPNGTTPLAGVIELETDVPVEVELTIIDGVDIRTVRFPAASQHYLPVLGLKADRTHAVDIELIPGGPIGSVFATTDLLPVDFPALDVNISTPAEMEPEYTFLDCFRRARSDTRPRFTIIVDSAGEVVWYSTTCFQLSEFLPTGKLLYREGVTVIETDLLGNLTTIALENPGGLHHDLVRTPHGTYLSLTQAAVEVPDYPTSDTDPNAPTATATVWDQPVVEFLPDGTIRKVWPLTDMLDPVRIGYGSLNSPDGGYDWIHTNAVNYRLEDNSIIVSGRHQDAVFSFSRETGDLNWILGPHDNWSPPFQEYLLNPVGSPFGWQYHQHAPMWTNNGTLLLFDNGNMRASPFDGITPTPQSQNYSRGVEYEIDEDLMEVRQVWEFGENIAESIYTGFGPDADSQDTTGNRLMTFCGVNFVGGVGSAILGLGDVHARIIETTNDVVPIEVFEMVVYDPNGSISVYLTERIPRLYPPGNIKAPNGVGRTLRVDKAAGSLQLSWVESPTDEEHSPADYYMVYSSTSPNAGFSMMDSIAFTNIGTDVGVESLVFYAIVAANTAGTSGDEPL